MRKRERVCVGVGLGGIGVGGEREEGGAYFVTVGTKETKLAGTDAHTELLRDRAGL